MNIQTIISNMSTILITISVMCILISVITEFTKEIGFLSKIPTTLLVLILSLTICTISFFAAISYLGIPFVWYYLVAVIFASFIVAIITAKGWDYLVDIIKRFYRDEI